jgi:lipopolysaccharide biosynthesis regulator YciM
MTTEPKKPHHLKGVKLSPERAAKARANLTHMGKGRPKGSVRPKASITDMLVQTVHKRGGVKFFENMTEQELKPLVGKLIERGENLEKTLKRHEEWLTYLEEPLP